MNILPKVVVTEIKAPKEQLSMILYMRTLQPNMGVENQRQNACIFYQPTENQVMKSEINFLNAKIDALVNTVNQNQESLVTSITENQQALVNSLQKEETNETVHEQIYCNICLKNVVGWRYKCSKCVDYDMCSGCYDDERYGITHPITHTQCCMIRIKCTKEYNKL